MRNGLRVILGRVVAVAVPLALCLSVLAAPASASFPGANGKIAFFSDRTTAGIYTMTATGGSQARLPGTTTTDRQPQWSPNGSKLAFFRDNQIYWIYANGTGLTQVTFLGADDLGLDWSPDGTRIAFVDNRSGNNEVYSVNATNNGSAESGLINVSNTSDRSDFEPSWKPTGGGSGAATSSPTSSRVGRATTSTSRTPTALGIQPG